MKAIYRVMKQRSRQPNREYLAAGGDDYSYLGAKNTHNLQVSEDAEIALLKQGERWQGPSSR